MRNSSSRAPGRSRRAVRRLLIAFLLVVAFLGAGIAPATAAPNITATLRVVSTLPVPSGGDVQYELDIQCGTVGDDACVNMFAAIALPPEIATLEVDPSSEFVESAAKNAAGALLVDFVDSVPGGTSLTIPFLLTTFNHTTPNGFTWSLTAEVWADDVALLRTDAAVARVSAEADIAITKHKSPGPVTLGDEFTYFIDFCDPNGSEGLGELDLISGTLTDPLPEHAVFVGASNGGVANVDQATGITTVTWDVPHLRLPDCLQPVQYSVTVIYPDDPFGVEVPFIEQVTNTAQIALRPIGYPSESVTASSSVTHQFTRDQSTAGLFGKIAYTPSALCCSPPLTYAGDWLTPSQGFEARYAFVALQTTQNVSFRLHDRLPCSTPWVDNGIVRRAAHVSPLDGEPVCAAPSFVPESLGISTNPVQNPAWAFFASAVAGGWRPQYIDVDGNSGDFSFVGNGALDLRFSPPDGVRIAEVIFPRHPLMIFPPGSTLRTFAHLDGHFIPNSPAGTWLDVQDGTVTHNRVDITTYNSAGNEGPTTSAGALVHVLLPKVAAGITKTITDQGRTHIRVINTGDLPLGAVIVTDLLPPGVTYGGELTATVGGTPLSGASLVDVEVIDGFAAGRQLVRFTLRPPTTIPVADFAAALEIGFRANGLAVNERNPGTIENTAQVHRAGWAIQACRGGGLVPPSQNDPFDLDGDNLTEDTFCAATARVDGPAPVIALVSKKTVRGDLDQAFTGSQSVGQARSGGTGTYKIEVSNRSEVPLEDVVLYDVLPVPNDTGVRLTDEPRGSEFRPTLSSIPQVVSPGGNALVEYSTAEVPCRGELQQLARNAWPANCDPTWSATPAELSDVTGIRVSQLGRLPLPAGNQEPHIEVTFDVRLPVSAGDADTDIAWNSFATAARRADNQQAILPTEAPKVGLRAIRPDVELTKLTNGVDVADAAGAPELEVGDRVFWTYIIENVGNEPLNELVLTDDQEFPEGLDLSTCTTEDGSTFDPPLSAQQSISCRVEGTVTEAGVYNNTADVSGRGTVSGDPVTDEDPSWYVAIVENPAISIKKRTVTNHTGPSGEDADTPDAAPYATPGSPVTWVYLITNSGDVPIIVDSLVDDMELEIDLAGCDWPGGNVSTDPLLPGETAVCRHDGTATAGLYSNVGTVTGHEAEDPEGPLTDEDPSHYYGGRPSLGIVKDVCKFVSQDECDPEDDSVWGQHQTLLKGSNPIWRITVTNTGDVTMEHVMLTDEVAPRCEQDLGTLAPGESRRVACVGTKLKTAMTNVAVATGTPVDNQGHPLTDNHGNPVPVPPVSDDAQAVPLSDDSTQTPPKAGGHDDGDDDGGYDGGWLPNTGSPAGLAVLGTLSLVTLAAGVVLVWHSRRKRQRSHPA